MAKFGVAGAPNNFYEKGNKTSLQMPKYLNSLGLDVFEYQCGRGVNISPQTAQKLRSEAENYDIMLTVHSPYYINIANPDAEKRAKSLDYILQTLHAADNMGAKRIVAHMGSAGDNRAAAMENSRKFIPYLMDTVLEQKLEHITICFETMGKINQLGDIHETLEICALHELLLPCIDFGHLNARTHGSLKTEADFEAILKETENILGFERASGFHCHFSKIMWTAGGEKKHLTFQDSEYGPEFPPLAAAIKKRNFSPIIISESSGTQDVDALHMQSVLSR